MRHLPPCQAPLEPTHCSVFSTLLRASRILKEFCCQPRASCTSSAAKHTLLSCSCAAVGCLPWPLLLASTSRLIPLASVFLCLSSNPDTSMKVCIHLFYVAVISSCQVRDNLPSLFGFLKVPDHCALSILITQQTLGEILLVVLLLTSNWFLALRIRRWILLNFVPLVSVFSSSMHLVHDRYCASIMKLRNASTRQALF